MHDLVGRVASNRAWRLFVRRLAPILLGATVVAACQGGLGADDSSKLHQQAEAALARWADAVAAAGGQSRVVLVGEVTGQVGTWEAAVGDNDKVALMAGLVVGDVAEPTAVPPDAEVQWPDGSKATVGVMSAAAALAAIRAGSDGGCDGCKPLLVTGARLTTGQIDTTRGPATGPVWEFAIQGTAVKVTHVALADPVTVVPPPWNPNDPPVGLAIDSASGTLGGRDLTVSFVGAPSPGDKPCGEDYTAEAVESDLAAVVIVTRHRNPAAGACSDVGALRTAAVRLADPLGDRAVLEVVQGLPVPVALGP